MTTHAIPVPPEWRVGDLLDQARMAVGPALRAAVGELPEAVREVATYHFGWSDLDGDGASGAERGWGKGVRAALVLACARAVGGTAAAAVPAAAAVELVHNASLIQDDLIDDDALRRHRPAVWAAYDAPTAILVGDALLAASVRALFEGSHRHVADATAGFLDAIQRLIAGEMADTAFESSRDVSLDQCAAMIADKTGALIEAACALGARYGDGSPEQISAMGCFGRHLGIAFQVVDDCLGIWGVSDITGKPVLADLRRRKKSLPVVYALTAGTPESTELAELYRLDHLLADELVERAAELVELTGARHWATDYGRRQVELSLGHLAAARPTTDGSAQLIALADLVRDREA
ncbi:polyprenyl synthetase family protein [Nocardia mangyaensis]|uniref:polyprenyl synthetase family protein n=1 Tax=Nocardia mangyaensis TaxID=2213200 RepID=UPI002676D583|nr:polyprenyl synthetase family protein [Nocardia mangyaensis]MDO3648235.1 polyprenyl synthetase family protein [Nocardia mangyaensis]